MTKEGWEESYRSGNTPWRGGDADYSRWLQEAGVSSGTALDLGCGTGEVSIWLADHDFDVEGIDFSEEALRVARERPSKAHFSAWDLENLASFPFRHEKYDLIVDNKTLAFVHDKARYLKTIREKLHGALILKTFLTHKKKPAIAIDRNTLEELLQDNFSILKKKTLESEEFTAATYFLIPQK